MPIFPIKIEIHVLSLDGSDLGVKVKLAEGGKLEYSEKTLESQIEIHESQFMCRSSDDSYAILM